MHRKYIIVLVLFGVAVLFVLFRDQVGRLLQIFGARPRDKKVRFADSIELTWGKYFWEGRTVLPAWAGFQPRLGPYAGISSTQPSNGAVQLSVSSPDDTIPAEPSQAQVSAFSYLRKNDAAMRDKVLKAIFDDYAKWRESYKDFLGEDFEKQMPELRTPADLKPLIGLAIVHVLNVEKDGLAYLGFEFGCEWEEEHGLGVMTHVDRVIQVGAAEEAFGASIAEQDKT